MQLREVVLLYSSNFCSSHPLLPSVYASMRRPEEYNKMINVVFSAIVLLFYLPMVIVGYDTFGDGVATPIYDTGPI